ncbi:MAG: hypothetical protein HY673_26430 [Chloroflexi bacterium]|nr:hypothetical protein [Chloroflexota bacterium]
MNNKPTYDHIKKTIVNRLNATGEMGYVETEVLLREGGKSLAKAHIVIFKFTLAANVTSEITVVQLKADAGEVNASELEALVAHFPHYAHRVFLCRPKAECSSPVASLCQRRGVGLLAVSTTTADGPEGMLTKVVESAINPQPKKWIDLYLRLERRGIPIERLV